MSSSSSSQLGKSESSMSNHQRLYDFAKMGLIKIFAHPYATVCELYCGEAFDAHKWLDSQIANYIGIGMYAFFFIFFSPTSITSLIIIADVSSSAIEQIRQSLPDNNNKSCTTHFFRLDPSTVSFYLFLLLFPAL